MKKTLKEIDKLIEKEDKDNTDELIGSELKYQRISQSRTLGSLAKHCSLSYVCKIETNAIKPNPRILAKLCEEVNINSEKLQVLLDSKSILMEMYKAYFFNDYDKVIEIYKKVETFNNYRCRIIRLFYYLKFKNYEQAVTICEDIEKIVSTLSVFDIMCFTLAYSILMTKRSEYKMAIKGLEKVNKFKIADGYIKAMANYYLMISYFYLDDTKNENIYNIAFESACNVFCYLRANRVRFLEITNDIRHGKDIKITMHNSLYDNTVNLLKSVKFNRTGYPYCEEFISDNYKLLSLYVKDFEGFVKSVKDVNLSNSNQHEYLYLLDLATSKSPERFLVVKETLFPLAKSIMDNFMIRKLGGELIEFYEKQNKYKSANKTLKETAETYK